MKTAPTIQGPLTPRSRTAGAFTLVEVMVVVALLSLIVLALMAVFDSTQKAFRASITQTDMLEGGRAAIDFMAADLRRMSPSGGASNLVTGPVNFYANTNAGVNPLMQPMVATAQMRENVLENFFVLSRENLDWRGVGYAVVPASTRGLYSLYRFESTPVRGNLVTLFNQFTNFLAAPTNYSHLMDGVVHLVVRPYDPDGVWMTNNVLVHNGQTNINRNVFYYPRTTAGAAGFKMFSATLPASVDIEMGVVEDRMLARAESRPNPSAYLTNASGQLHVFRERVSVPNVDPSAYR